MACKAHPNLCAFIEVLQKEQAAAEVIIEQLSGAGRVKKSYLTNRFQRVVFKGCSSTWLPVRSGVPQGSILGPLLFLLYMNDISDVPLTPGTKLFLFAEDILLFKPIKSDSDFCDFQKDIDTISNWTVANHLTLNANKTKVMLISRNRKSQCPSFSLNGIQIEKVRHSRHLAIR